MKYYNIYIKGNSSINSYMASRDWNLIQLDISNFDYMVFEREVPESKLGQILYNCLNHEGNFNIKIEYTIDKSAQHPTSEGDDIVRAYTKDKYKNQEIKNS